MESLIGRIWMQPKLREGTCDHDIWYNIVGKNNEYRLPDQMPGWNVVDVGAHIGAFSYACLERGAFVTAFEPHPLNYRLLMENLWEYVIDERRLSIYQNSVSGYYCGWNTISVFPDLGDLINTGGAVVKPGPIPETVFDATFSIPAEYIFQMIHHIDLLKLDCEGAEWLILETIPSMGAKIDRIYGEFHEGVIVSKEYTVKDLLLILENCGYTVEWFRHGDSNLGMFFAERERVND
jgi:FkbM family methyltransferase